jgi:hypothetical protein
MLHFRKIAVTFLIFSSFLVGCGEIITYPDTPIINYKNFSLYSKTDTLGNSIFLGKMEIRFTDGDGDLGLSQPEEDTIVLPDSLKYNFFTRLYNMNNGVFEKINGPTGEQNFRIPYISRKGQNKILKGSIFIEFEYYKPVEYDTIFYTFYMVDRAFHKSNADTSDVIIFPG